MLKIGGLYKIKPKKLTEIDGGQKIYLPVFGHLLDFDRIIAIENCWVLTYLGLVPGTINDGNQNMNISTPMFVFDGQKITVFDANKPTDKQEYLYEEVKE